MTPCHPLAMRSSESHASGLVMSKSIRRAGAAHERCPLFIGEVSTGYVARALLPGADVEIPQEHAGLVCGRDSQPFVGLVQGQIGHFLIGDSEGAHVQAAVRYVPDAQFAGRVSRSVAAA